MATIKVNNKQELEFQIQKAIKRKMDLVFDDGKKLLIEQAKVYRDKFANSTEYQNIKTKFVGEFGFTPQEVAGLDRILDLMIPGNNDITISFFDKVGTSQFLILEWVDFEKLKKHPVTQHELTRLNKDGNVIGITDIISWIEWLEEGVTVAGYSFFKPNQNNVGFSRSREGLMRKAGGFFSIEPTRILKKIESESNINVLKKGFGLLVKRHGKG